MASRTACFGSARPLTTRVCRRSLVTRASAGSARPQRKRPEYIPNRIDDPNYVRVFDTTLRDGEQSPGATLTSKEKMEIAKQLQKLGAPAGCFVEDQGHIHTTMLTAGRDSFICMLLIAAHAAHWIQSMAGGSACHAHRLLQNMHADP